MKEWELLKTRLRGTSNVDQFNMCGRFILLVDSKIVRGINIVFNGSFHIHLHWKIHWKICASLELPTISIERNMINDHAFAFLFFYHVFFWLEAIVV